MDDVLMSGTTPAEVMVQPGVNITPAGKIAVTLLEWPSCECAGQLCGR